MKICLQNSKRPFTQTTNKITYKINKFKINKLHYGISRHISVKAAGSKKLLNMSCAAGVWNISVHTLADS